MDRKIFPNREKLSIVIAVITLLLGISFTLPSSALDGAGAGIIWAERLFPVLVAILSYLGTIWIFSEPPGVAMVDDQRTLQLHLLLPVLSMYVLTIALLQMEKNATWWWIYLAGILLYGSVVFAEYREIYNPKGQTPLEGILLIALSHALFFILCTIFKLGVLRLIIVVPSLFLASFFISLRMTKLRTGQINYWLIFVIALILTQLATGLFYIFVTPVQYGLILTAFLYAFISLTVGILEKRKSRTLILEPAVMFIFVVLYVVFSTLR